MRKWAFLLALASCTSFGADPGPGGSVDAGAAGDAPSDGALVDGSVPVDAGTLPTGQCADWSTGSGVAVTCPGEGQPRMLATDPENCGRCGLSCGAGGSCEEGHCKDVDRVSGVRLLGAGPSGALLFRDQDRQVAVLSPGREPDNLARIADAAPEPVAAVAWGDRAYARTPSALVPCPPIGTIAPFQPSPPNAPPTIAATDAGVFVPGPDNLKRFPHDNLLNGSEIRVPGITEVTAAAAPVVIQATQGSAASLAWVDGNGALRGLVADAGKARSLVAHGRDAFYVDGLALMRVSLDGGAPEVLVRVTNDISAYMGRPAVAVTSTTVFFVVARENDYYDVMAVERGCTTPAPRRVAVAQNLAGIAANETHLFYVANTNTLRSQRIASKNP